MSKVIKVTFSKEMFQLHFLDGRILSIPFNLIPGLKNTSKETRENVALLGDGTALHWPEIDEDLTVNALLQGKKIIDWKNHE